jgi:hypothetical protein
MLCKTEWCVPFLMRTSLICSFHLLIVSSDSLVRIHDDFPLPLKWIVCFPSLDFLRENVVSERIITIKMTISINCFIRQTIRISKKRIKNFVDDKINRIENNTLIVQWREKMKMSTKNIFMIKTENEKSV